MFLFGLSLGFLAERRLVFSYPRLPTPLKMTCRKHAASEDRVMPKYLVEGRYTSEGVKGLVREGSLRRRDDIAKMIESAGGKLETLYFAFGDADFFIIYDAPDNIPAAALSVVANQSGFVTSKIIALMTADEMEQAIRKSMDMQFAPFRN
jgi:uncharacterized protein with GYD domain